MISGVPGVSGVSGVARWCQWCGLDIRHFEMYGYSLYRSRSGIKHSCMYVSSLLNFMSRLHVIVVVVL